MKKTLSLYDQVNEAKKEVDSWPDSIKSATVVCLSDFFPAKQEDEVQSTNKKSKLVDSFKS